MFTSVASLAAILLALGSAASPLTSRAVNPVLKASNLYGPITQTTPNYLDRDSCGSTQWGNRALFVCRDTEIYKNLANRSEGVTAFYSSSASWINKNADGSLPFVAFTPEPGTPASESNFTYRLPAYGANPDNLAFYPTQPDECDAQTGSCDNNGTRWVIWPDSAPLVTTSISSSTTTAYTWVKKAYITDSLGVVIPYPATSLYKLTGPTNGTSDTLPTVSLVEETFWPQNTFPYGDFGNIIIDGTAYLFGALNNGSTSLAKVPVSGIEDSTLYQYYVNGAWTTTMPDINTPGAIFQATPGGQGTFYYSEPWNSYVWIGQNVNDPTLTLQITTAPSITGPWTTPTNFFSQANSPGVVYSVQAHPAFLASPTTNSAWVSYTIAISDYGYDTILYRFDWQ